MMISAYQDFAGASISSHLYKIAHSVSKVSDGEELAKSSSCDSTEKHIDELRIGLRDARLNDFDDGARQFLQDGVKRLREKGFAQRFPHHEFTDQQLRIARQDAINFVMARTRVATDYASATFSKCAEIMTWHAPRTDEPNQERALVLRAPNIEHTLLVEAIDDALPEPLRIAAWRQIADSLPMIPPKDRAPLVLSSRTLRDAESRLFVANTISSSASALSEREVSTLFDLVDTLPEHSDREELFLRIARNAGRDTPALRALQDLLERIRAPHPELSSRILEANSDLLKRRMQVTIAALMSVRRDLDRAYAVRERYLERYLHARLDSEAKKAEILKYLLPPEEFESTR